MKFIDQMNNTILLSEIPKRIVSLVPSITELLVDLGLREKIVGITKFCNQPSDLKKQYSTIGGTKNINIDKIKELKPDIVFANKEENVEHDVLEIKKFTNVWISDVKTVNDNFDLIKNIGDIFNKKELSKKIIHETKFIFDNLKINNLKNKTVLYLIWKKPYMSVGIDTYIHDILTKIGLTNFITDKRYPIVEFKNLPEIDYIFLSSEPYPFDLKEKQEIERLKINSKVFLIDGTMFSWYGSRISKSSNYFQELITKLEY